MKNQTKEVLQNLTSDELDQIIERIIYLRQNVLTMTQQQFADAIKISQTYLSLIENRKKNINSDTIIQIVYMLKVNLDWLIYGIGDDKNIFQNHLQSKECVTQSLKNEALANLKSAYSLKEDDIQLIHSYLELTEREKSNIRDALRSISKLL